MTTYFHQHHPTRPPRRPAHRARPHRLRDGGGREQPSDVTDVDGVTTITLRNINGPLAVYELRGAKLQRLTQPEAVGAA